MYVCSNWDIVFFCRVSNKPALIQQVYPPRIFLSAVDSDLFGIDVDLDITSTYSTICSE